VPLLRRLPVAAVIAVALASYLVSTGVTASAQPPDKPPACSDTLPQLRYLVLFDPGTAQAAARREVAGACGRLTGYYPQIGVAVAVSPDGRFAERLGRDRAFSAQRVLRLRQAPSKTDETESTPAQVTSNTVSTVDLMGEQWDMDLIHADRSRAIDEGSRDVVVGVLDSGVDPTHPDLRAALRRSPPAACPESPTGQGRRGSRPGPRTARTSPARSRPRTTGAASPGWRRGCGSPR
jgi:hypothetical protein